MKKLLLSGVLLISGFSVLAQDLPTNAEPGKCYVRCKTPEVWKNQDVTVEVAPAYKKLTVVPASYKKTTERVVGKEKGKTLTVVPAKFKNETFTVTTVEPSYSLRVIPETFENVTETIVVKEASKRLEIVPAVYKKETFTVEVQPAYTKLVVVPAKYETKTQSVVCQADSKRLNVIPGKWGTKTIPYKKREFGTKLSVIPASFSRDSETLEVRAASARWQMSDKAPDCESSDPNDCRYWCYKEVPAQYTTVNKTLLTKDANISRNNECDDPDCGNGTYTVQYQTVAPEVKETVIPEVVKTYTTKVMVTPPTTREITVPAKTKTFTRTVMVTPPTTREITIPAVTKTITKRIVRPATTRKIEIPGKTKEMIKTVEVSPARVNETTIPEEMKTITKTILYKDAYTNEVTIPAKYKTITKEVLVSKGGLTTWKEVDCELVNNTPLPINWNLGSATLTPAAKRIIDARLLPILKNGVAVVIESHTDSRGSKTSNQSLSERRAGAVVKYLMTKGVNGSQLTANGYGENRLTNRCADGVSCTEREHATNRRTTFRVINQK